MLNSLRQKKEILLISALFIVTLLAPVISSNTYMIRIVWGWVILYCLTIGEKPLEQVKNYYLANTKVEILAKACLVIIGLSFVVMGIIFRCITYCAMGATFIVCIPLSQSLMKKGRFAENMQKALCVTFLVIIAVSFMFGQAIGYIQFGGVLLNQNNLGFACAIFLAATLTLDGKNGKYHLQCLAIALVIVFAIFSTSRTALLATITEIIILLIYYFVSTDKANRFSHIKKGIITIIMIIVLFPLCFQLFTDGKAIIANTMPSIQVVVEEPCEMGEFMDRLFGHYSKGIGENYGDAFSAGRMEIWSTFIPECGIKGHAKEGLAVKSKTRTYPNTTAHNAILQIAFTAGIIAGLAFFMYLVVVGVQCLRIIVNAYKKKKASLIEWFCVLVAVAYAWIAITSSMYMMFAHFSATVFWFTSGYIISWRKETQ